MSVRDERDGDLAACQSRCDVRQPAAEPAVGHPAAAAVRDGDDEPLAHLPTGIAGAPKVPARRALTVGIHRTLRTP